MDAMTQLQPGSKSADEGGTSVHILSPYNLGITRDIISEARPDLNYEELPDVLYFVSAHTHGKDCIPYADLITSCKHQDDDDGDMKFKIIGIIAHKLRIEHLAQQARLATASISNSRLHRQHQPQQQQHSDDGQLRNGTGSSKSQGWSKLNLPSGVFG